MVTVSIKANLSEIVLSSCLQPCILGVFPGPKAKLFLFVSFNDIHSGTTEIGQKSNR